MKLQYRNGFIAFSAILLFILGLLIPIVVTDVMGVPTHQATIEGNSIADSVFNEISSQNQVDPMFPGEAAISTSDGVRMVADYSKLERINESSAIASALQFANSSSYLAGQNLTLDTGWTRLDPTYWTLRFFGNNTTVYVTLNAFSGAVIDFQIRWKGPSPYVRDYNGTDSMTESEIEGHALAFLRNHNYSLSQQSIYTGPQLEYDIDYLTDYVYTLRFFDVINMTMVWGNIVQINLDIKTGDMVGFAYSWTFISSINTQDSISSQRAEGIALNYVNGLEKAGTVSVVSSVLILSKIRSTPFTEYRLMWAVSLDSERVGKVLLDGVSGEVLGVYEYVVASPILRTATPQVELTAYVLFPPLILAVSGFVLARKRVWRRIAKVNARDEK